MNARKSTSICTDVAMRPNARAPLKRIINLTYNTFIKPHTSHFVLFKYIQLLWTYLIDWAILFFDKHLDGSCSLHSIRITLIRDVCIMKVLKLKRQPNPIQGTNQKLQNLSHNWMSLIKHICIYIFICAPPCAISNANIILHHTCLASVYSATRRSQQFV